jgi:hypothetical protein
MKKELLFERGGEAKASSSLLEKNYCRVCVKALKNVNLRNYVMC